jgi:cobalamin-dependent methionine synthase-like protein
MATDQSLQIQSFKVPVDALPLQPDLILQAMGYDPKTKQNIPGLLIPEIERFINDAPNHLEIQAGFRQFSPAEVIINKNDILLKDKILQSGRIINGQIKQAECLLVFVCTLGHKYDAWIKSITVTDDMFSTYIIDTIGSELVELAIDWLEKQIGVHCSRMGVSHSNRFSPGYCGWPLMDQHKIFSFLPQNFCGIFLHDSALMRPVKSVSGIYGLGKSIKKKAYQCSICDKKDCFKRYHQAI